MRGGRLAVGCLVGLIALVGAGVALASWAAGTPLPELFGTWREIQRVETLRDDPRLQASWTPADGALLSERQIERWLEVQRALRAELEPRLEELEGRAEEIEAGEAGPLETFRAGIAVARTLSAAGVAHGEALLAHEFSFDEYRWVRDRIVRAADLGERLAELEATRDALGGGLAPGPSDDGPDGPEPEALARDAAPPEEAELVARYRDEVVEHLAYAWFGL